MKTLGISFFKTIGILLGILVFFLAISIGSSSLNKYFNQNIGKYTFIEGNKKSLNKIIILELNGVILNSSRQGSSLLNPQIIYANKMERILNNLSKEKDIKAIIVSINSPGGSVSGSNRLYEIFLDFKKRNIIPIYIHSNELLASGALWSAAGATKIYASYGALIGSIGVKGPSWFVYKEPKSIKSDFFEPSISTDGGIDYYQPYAGKSKDIFNSFRNPTQEELLMIQEMVDSIYNKFLNIISKHRKIEKDYIKENLGAMIFDSKKAKYHNLIDDVININELKKIILKSLKIEDDYQIIKIDSKFNIINEISNITFRLNNKNKINVDICNLSNQQFLLISKFDFNACKN